MKEIKAYKCDFCEKVYQRKHNIQKHEARCSKNPENQRACFGCKYLDKETVGVWFDSPLGGGDFENRIILHCNKRQCFVYPPIVEHKQNQYELDEANEPMPRECEFRDPDFVCSSVSSDDFMN